MRLKAIEFSGYPAGVTNFSTLLSTVPQPGFNHLDVTLQIVVQQLTQPVPNTFVSLIVVGHADRQDRADLRCDERRASEIAAASDRATSAWEWIKTEVASRVAAAGGDAGDWWETSPHVTWGLVFAAAGMLKHNPPADEQQRSENRRVTVLVSIFSPE